MMTACLTLHCYDDGVFNLTKSFGSNRKSAVRGRKSEASKQTKTKTTTTNKQTNKQKQTNNNNNKTKQQQQQQQTKTNKQEATLNRDLTWP